MRSAILMFALVLSGVYSGSAAVGQVTDQQKAQYSQLQQLVKQAQQLNRTRKYAEAAAAVVRGEKLAEGLNASLKVPFAKRLVATEAGRLQSIRRLLERRRVKFPDPNNLPATPAPGTTNPTTPQPGTPAGQVSFLKDVAPMLTSKCARCHMGTARRGNFSMNTFADLMRGANGVRVIDANDGKSSRIVEVIESGDMPRGGGRVGKAELQKMIAWIDAGAKFDGSNPNMPISAAAPAPAATPRPQLQVTQATGNEKVSFSKDIAPILVKNCTGCHGERNPSGDLGMANFQRLLRGGDTGVAITPGKAGESLLIGKLKGTAEGQRMPLRRPALPTEQIVLFETWINEGAKFDGPDPAMPLQTVASIGLARSMDHQQLIAHREKLAQSNWTLANPSEEFRTIKTDHFTVIGNVSQDQLQRVGKVAEDQYDKVTKLLKHSSSKPLIKGNLTVFVFRKSFEYSEFAKMVEKRDIPFEWKGHSRFSVVDAYAAVAPIREDVDSLDRVMAEVIAGAYLESLGGPLWFVQGASRAISAKLEPKSPKVEQWNDSLPGVLTRVTGGEQLLNGALGLRDSAIAFYGFGTEIVKHRGFTLLIQGLKSGKPFDEAFKTTFRQEPSDLAWRWAKSGGTRRR